ncbi:MAG: hypothetical protein RR557_07875 [Bacilli bacterium]
MFKNNEYILKGDIEIRGEFAFMMRKLKLIFDTGWEIYYIAGIVGSIQGVCIEPEKSNIEPFKIFSNEINNHESEIKMSYIICMLLTSPEDEKKENAFKYYTPFEGNEAASERSRENCRVFNKYVLGGIKFLYDNLLNDNVSQDIKKENYKIDDEDKLIKAIHAFVGKININVEPGEINESLLE